MNCDFWRGKRVFLTGHTGFKGSWLALWLDHLGAKVVGYALDPPTSPSLFQAADLGSMMASIGGDVRDLELLRSSLKDHQPEVVFHLAAQSQVRESFRDPVTTYSTNVLGTVNVLEAVRHTPSARVVVVVTSDKCYYNQERNEAYNEDARLGGRDPYSNSKGCAELVTEAYRESFFSQSNPDKRQASIGSARAGNVIGGGDWAAERLIPDTLSAFGAGRAVRLRNPRAIRPWQHVLDPLHGYLLLAEHLWKAGSRFAQGWNFGADEEWCQPVSWVIDRLAALWGNGAAWETDPEDHPPEAQLLRLDCSKAKTQLGWHPLLPLPSALEWTLEWHRCYNEGRPMRSTTQCQISRFQAMIAQASSCATTAS